MSAEKPYASLPIIDFSRKELLEKGSSSWESVKRGVKEALEEYGSFQAVYKQKVENAIEFSALDELFALPQETKKTRDDNTSYTYFSDLSHGPLFEGFTIYHPTSLENITSFTELMWSQGNPDFSNTLHSYFKEVAGLHEIIRTMVLESLGVEQLIDELEKMTCYTIGIQKYDEPNTADGKIGLNPHKDSNFLTILHQNDVEGLQMRTKDGQWFPVNPTRNSFVVVMGESLEAWSNGRFHVPVHRVEISGSKRRYSVGLFTNPIYGVLIKAPDELVDEEHPMLYKPFEYLEYRTYRKKHSASGTILDLKSYCTSVL